MYPDAIAPYRIITCQNLYVKNNTNGIDVCKFRIIRTFYNGRVIFDTRRREFLKYVYVLLNCSYSMVYKLNSGNDKDASFTSAEAELQHLRKKNIKRIVELCKNCVKAEYRIQLNEGRYQLMFTPVGNGIEFNAC